MSNDELLHDCQLAPATMQVRSYPIAQNTMAGGTLVARGVAIQRAWVVH
jgi:hypothetical protein